MKLSVNPLRETLTEALGFIDDAKGMDDSTISVCVLREIQQLSFHAEEAAAASDIRDQYFQAANELRDLCVRVGHPNTLKEDSVYKRIQRSFPDFENPLA